MPDTARARFNCASVRASPEELAALGIAVEDPFGTIMHRLYRGQLMVGIGQLVIIDSTIHTIPKHGLTAGQLAHLTGAAEDAFFVPPSELNGWELDNGRWTTWITVPADTVSAAALAAATSADSDRTTSRIA